MLMWTDATYISLLLRILLMFCFISKLDHVARVLVMHHNILKHGGVSVALIEGGCRVAAV